MKSCLCILGISVMCLVWSVLLLTGCSKVRPNTYDASQHTTISQSNNSEGGIIILVEDGTTLLNVVEFEYNPDTNNVHYVRKETDGKDIKGVLPYKDITIHVGDGLLVYEGEWKFVANGFVYLIHKDMYKDVAFNWE